jgi:hypothetical protein
MAADLAKTGLDMEVLPDGAVRLDHQIKTPVQNEWAPR